MKFPENVAARLDPKFPAKPPPKKEGNFEGKLLTSCGKFANFKDCVVEEEEGGGGDEGGADEARVVVQVGEDEPADEKVGTKELETIATAFGEEDARAGEEEEEEGVKCEEFITKDVERFIGNAGDASLDTSTEPVLVIVPSLELLLRFCIEI